MAKKSNNNNNGPHWWSLNKVAFYTIAAAAILYLVSMILHLVGFQNITGWLQGVATAIMICIVSILAYRYVRNKPTVWLVLYIVVLLVVLVGIVVPAITLW